jgi:hypothetical protein
MGQIKTDLTTRLQVLIQTYDELVCIDVTARKLLDEVIFDSSAQIDIHRLSFKGEISSLIYKPISLISENKP